MPSGIFQKLGFGRKNTEFKSNEETCVWRALIELENSSDSLCTCPIRDICARPSHIEESEWLHSQAFDIHSLLSNLLTATGGCSDDCSAPVTRFLGNVSFVDRNDPKEVSFSVFAEVQASKDLRTDRGSSSFSFMKSLMSSIQSISCSEMHPDVDQCKLISLKALVVIIHLIEGHFEQILAADCAPHAALILRHLLTFSIDVCGVDSKVLSPLDTVVKLFYENHSSV